VAVQAELIQNNNRTIYNNHRGQDFVHLLAVESDLEAAVLLENFYSCQLLFIYFLSGQYYVKL